jgi:hypothetical protein
MQTSTKSRLFAVLGLLLACSCWITAPALFGTIMGERVIQDPAEQARFAASQRFWSTVLLGSWLFALVGSSAIAGVTLRTNRVLSLLTWLVLLAFIVLSVTWLGG